MSSLSPQLDGRIGAVFNEQRSAETLSATLVDKSVVNASDVNVIAPKDHEYNRKLEGSSRQLGKRMLKDHVIWAIGGLVIGAAVAALLVLFGPQLTQQNPVFTFIALISPGIFCGLFVSGLLALRPDHDIANEQVRDAAKQGEWTVIVSLNDGINHDKVMSIIRESKPQKVI